MAEIRLYGFWRSLASYRVRVALRLKGLHFEERSVDLLAGAQLSDEFAQVTALRAVPVLEIDGTTLAQSLAILEYLEETRPEVPLLPADPMERAAARSMALATIADAHPLIVPRVRRYLGERLSLGHDGIEAWGRHWLAEGLGTFERLLSRRPPAPFAFGERVGIADIAVGSHVAGAELFAVPLDPYPHVRGLADALAEVDAFAQSHPSRLKPDANAHP